MDACFFLCEKRKVFFIYLNFKDMKLDNFKILTRAEMKSIFAGQDGGGLEGDCKIDSCSLGCRNGKGKCSTCCVTSAVS